MKVGLIGIPEPSSHPHEPASWVGVCSNRIHLPILWQQRIWSLKWPIHGCSFERLYIFDHLSYLRNPLPQKMHRESIQRTTRVRFYRESLENWRWWTHHSFSELGNILPSWKLTYPTYGRRTWSSQLPLKGMCLKSIGQLNYISHSDGCMILTAVAQWMSHESSCDCIVRSYIFGVSLSHTF